MTVLKLGRARQGPGLQGFETFAWEILWAQGLLVSKTGCTFVWPTVEMSPRNEGR